jgi:hypothetical protein
VDNSEEPGEIGPGQAHIPAPGVPFTHFSVREWRISAFRKQARDGRQRRAREQDGHQGPRKPATARHGRTEANQGALSSGAGVIVQRRPSGCVPEQFHPPASLLPGRPCDMRTGAPRQYVPCMFPTTIANLARSRKRCDPGKEDAVQTRSKGCEPMPLTLRNPGLTTHPFKTRGSSA